MHELGVTQDILKQALDALDKRSAAGFEHAAGRGPASGGPPMTDTNTPAITKIHLTIGEYNQLVPENIEYYFEVLAKGTAAEQAELIIKRTPVRAKCTSCGVTFDIKGFNFLCPDCGGIAGDLVSGKELRVESIEISDGT